MAKDKPESMSPSEPPSQALAPEEDVQMEDAPEESAKATKVEEEEFATDSEDDLDAEEPVKVAKVEEEEFATDSEDEAAPEKAAKETKLEDLFDDSEDENEGSEAVHTPQSSDEDSKKPAPTEEVQRKATDPEILRAFYQRLFPWKHLFQWLNHSPVATTDFTHREFAFTLENEAYLRYQSYTTSELFKKDVVNIIPTRFEIGPIYSANPRDRKSFRNHTSFKPLAKELCFDIDLTDYDDVRTCCDRANICRKCWTFATMAIEVVDTALREDFGFKHIMWVYSGRRGVHAWVCDRAARNMTDQQRKAVIGYLDVIKGGNQSGKKVNLPRPLHRHIKRSIGILKPYFAENILRDQDPWGTSERAEKLLQLLPNKALVDSLKAEWESSPDRSSAQRWSDIRKVNLTAANKRAGATRKTEDKIREAMEDIMLEYTYPRLDVNVSKTLNHLLKSPFVIHPGTGRVCVPIDLEKLEEFNPLAAPTIHEVLREIDEWKGEEEGGASQDSGNGRGVADWEKTSLKPYVEVFRSFVAGLLKDEMGQKVKRERDEDGKMEF